MKHALALAAVALSSALSAAPALAQPSYAQPPSYAVKMDTIHGRIVSFDSHFALTVRDDRGYVDNVTLHEGTVINPRGLRLAPGMSVTVVGRPGGSSLLADEIDTRYHEDGPAYYAPPYGYYAPGYPFYYPYPCCYDWRRY